MNKLLAFALLAAGCAGAKKAGKDVRYVVFPDEGHRRDYGNWRNALRHYAEVEEFLARCLGGRTSRPDR